MIAPPLPLFARKVIIFAGAYGSGKTEVAVNYAIYHATTTSESLSIVDLDIVNPYFRSREAAGVMTALGINVILPLGEHCHADLPIIVPEIRAAIENGEGKVILDVGGDDIGARVLSSLVDAIETAGYEFLMVLNANRPFTATVSGSARMMQGIEKSSRLKITGLVSNTHLIEETTAETVLQGYRLARSVAETTGLPLAFVSAMAETLVNLGADAITAPLLPLKRQMLKPWEEDSRRLKRI